MIKDEILQLLEPTVLSMGYELWGCEHFQQGRHSLLRVYIDKEGGIGIKDCEQVSRQISALLDVENPIVGQYQLEVSSPGIPRTMFRPEQYQRFIGHSAHIKLQKPMMGVRQLKGIIVSANEQFLVLECDGLQQEFLFSNIVKARVE
ncbi:MAG: ribosome maturation factor RimP [Legionellales bacterium]|nr:ribosome maturation factor RimP [Legionellales bacterium]